MDKKSAHFVLRATDHLFQLAQSLTEPENEIRSCEWVVQSLWRELLAVSGPNAAAVLFGRAFLEASDMWPLIGKMEVTERGIDTAALRRVCDLDGCGLLGEACKTAVRNCLGLVATLSGEDLARTLVDRVEAELRGLGAPSEVAEHPEHPEQPPTDQTGPVAA